MFAAVAAGQEFPNWRRAVWQNAIVQLRRRVPPFHSGLKLEKKGNLGKYSTSVQCTNDSQLFFFSKSY